MPAPTDAEAPTTLGRADGLSYALFLPDEPAPGGVVVLHGAGSCKENHFDFARRCRDAGLAAVAFDQRGHGGSEGPMGAGAVDDVIAVAELLPPGPRGVRGSSMGGFLALAAGARMDAAAVVAICPASAEALALGLRSGRLHVRADHPAVEALLAASDLAGAAAALGPRLLLLHAEGDEQVPVAHSRALHAQAPGSRLVTVDGGHHRSVQHDPELQELAVRFLTERLRPAADR